MNLSNTYAVPSLVSGICFTVLAIYVLWHNPRRTQNQVTTLFFAAFAIWSWAEMVQRFSGPAPDVLLAQFEALGEPYPPTMLPDFEVANLATRVLALGVLIIAPTIVHFSLVVPRKRIKNALTLLPLYVTSIVMMVMVMGTDIFITDPKPYYAGWGTSYGDGFYVYFGFPLVCVFFAIARLALSGIRAESAIERNQCMYVIAGMVAAVSLVIVTAIVPVIMDWDLYPLSTPSLIILALSMTYSMVKYKLLAIEAVTEEEIEHEIQIPELEPGLSYMFHGSDTATPYLTFRTLVSERPGLCVTTRSPPKVRQMYRLEKTPIVWLTSVTTQENALSPFRLDFEIIYTIHTFMQENKDTVVLVDGVNYLSKVNGTEKTAEFMKAVNDFASSTGSTLITPIDPRPMSEREGHMYSDSFDKVLRTEARPQERTLVVFNKLVIADDVAGCYGEFRALLKNRPGLCISKTFPGKLTSQYDLGEVRLCWLSETESEHEVLSPTRIDFEASQTILDFYRDNKGGVLILDGLSSLLMENGMDKTLEFVKTVVDTASQNWGFFIAHVRPEAMKDEDLALYETLFDFVERG